MKLGVLAYRFHAWLRRCIEGIVRTPKSECQCSVRLSATYGSLKRARRGTRRLAAGSKKTVPLKGAAMSRRSLPTLAAIAVAVSASVSAAAFAAALSVVFVDPDKFTDAAYSHRHGTGQERAEVMRDIERHLRQLVEGGLAADDALRVEVLDIDLAGWFEPFRFRTGTDVRVLRDITWPRIELHYTLTRGDRVIASAEEQVLDLNYLMTVNRYGSSDRLRYEKAMLDDWFSRHIVAQARLDRTSPEPAPSE